MANEARLEDFFEMIGEKIFSFGEVSEMDEISQGRLALLLRFLDKDRADTVCDELISLKSSDEEKYKTIVKNLARLYPLSQELVLTIINRIKDSDYEFYEGFDIEERMYEALKRVHQQRSSLTNRFNEYEKDIKELNEKKDKLKNAVEKFQSKRDEMANLKREIESLTEDKERDWDKALNDLKDEKEALLREKGKSDRKLRELRKEIDDLKSTLQDSEGKMSDEEKKLWHELIRMFPKDMEE